MLFLSAYAPLFVIFAIRFDSPSLRWGAVMLALLGVVAMAWVWARRRRLAAQPRRVASLQDEGGAVAGYTATYLLPFVTVSDPAAADVIAYACVFAMLGLLHVRTNLIQVNPMLYLIGRRVLRFIDGAGESGYAIVRASETVQIGSVLRSVPWSGDVYWTAEVLEDHDLAR
jgi:hypothetical protein